MSSAAKPVNQPDALRLLLDRIPRGGDATLIAEGDAGDVLLDLVADCLSGQRLRILRTAEALPSRLAAHTPSATAGVPDDEALSRSFQALTALDPACDRIVLLVGDAHALQLPALRYIQFASRAGAHLQLVFCGTRAVFDLLNIEEFAWLRTRLMAGLVLTLAAPVPEAPDAPPPPAPDDPEAEAWAGENAVPFSSARRPAIPDARRSRPLLLGALALLGLGGAAGFVLGSQGGAGRPAASRQAASVVQPPTFPDAPAPATPAGGAASQAAPATPEIPSLPPAMAGDAPGAGPRPPSSMAAAPPPAGAPDSPLTIWSQSRAGAPEKEPRPPEPSPDLARPGRPGAPAASSRAATAAPGSRARRLREARDQPPPRDDQWVPSEPALGSWTASGSQPPRYIGSYAADANGVRVFRPEP